MDEILAVPSRRPDALLVPFTFVPEAQSAESADEKVMLIATSVKRLWGEGRQQTIRKHPTNEWLITESHDETWGFPSNHPTFPKMPRHDWADGPNGIKIGYLKAEAKSSK
jgi:hypothetical protein